MSHSDDPLEERLATEWPDIDEIREPEWLAGSVARAIRSTPQERRRRPSRIDWAVLTAATALLAVSVPPMLIGLGSEPPPSISPPPSTTTSVPSNQLSAAPSAESASLEGTWRQTAIPPIGGRTDHTLTWSESELLIWGGSESDDGHPADRTFLPSHGAAYVPERDSWRRLVEAPIDGRNSPVTAWTGTELLTWGGWRTSGSGIEYLNDGAAYDPMTDQWRMLPDAPLVADEAVGGWLTEQLIIITSDAAAAYDPAQNRWRPLDAAPVRAGWRIVATAAGVLTVIAFGDGATGSVDGATIDPQSWRWATLETPLDPGDAGVTLIGVGEAAIIPALGLRLDPRAGTWYSVTECAGAASGPAWTDRLVIGLEGAYEPATDVCLDMPKAPPRAAPFDDTTNREFAIASWTGLEYLTWGGGTGRDATYVPNDGAVFRPTTASD
jgi:hypothetical protein